MIYTPSIRSHQTRAQTFIAGMPRVWAFACLFLALFGGIAPVLAAESESVGDANVSARLLTAENGIAPGAASVSAGLHVTLGDGWKTYWRSPGEVGLPPEIHWDGSQNVADVEFLWPTPTRFRAFGIENFGYASEVVFPMRIALAEPGAPTELRGTLNLLICSDICVPKTLELSLDLPAGTGSDSGGGNTTDIDTASATLIAAAVARVPDASTAGVEPGTAHLDDTALTVTLRSNTPFVAPDIFPEQGTAAFGVPDIRLGEDGRLLWARLPLLAGDDTAPLSVTVADGPRAATFDLSRAAVAPEPPIEMSISGPDMGERAWIVLVALLGGLILNVMPCVLPVLSIKLSSAIQSQGMSSARVRSGFLVSALGVMAFMWLLAGATIGAKSLGLAVGWGLQFQNPFFLAGMIALLGLFAANLFGLFEITLPQSWTTAMAKGESRKGLAGDFATGAFAAVLATPCSAPFLGTAVAFALSGGAVDIVLVFSALGLGLALPYLVVAARPAMIRSLPRPGRWMLAVRALLGGLLALTAAWLIWVLAAVAGPVAAALAIGILAVGSLALLVVRHKPGRAALVAVIMAAAVLVVPALAPRDVSGGATDKIAGTETIWQPFERAEIARLVSEGRTVFVDVTADWCLTCKANKALVLSRGDVALALAQPDVVPMRADWTRPDPVIARYLETNGRYGIPFNIVYGPAAPEGIALPELLSTDAVLDALSRAGRGPDSAT